MEGGDFMGHNPKRTPNNQTYHDNILKALAIDMQSNGYSVKADHISWPYGCPKEVYGHIPDVIATSSNSGNFIIEVEDCSTYADEHTKQQLMSFSKLQGFTCYIIVPSVCIRNDNKYGTKDDIKTILYNWGLPNIRVGLYDWNSKKIIYNV